MIPSYLMYFPNIIYQFSLKHVALSSNSSISALHLLNVNFRKVLVMMNPMLSSQRLSRLQEDCLPQMMNRLARNISLQNLNTFLLILLNQYTFLLILRLIVKEIVFWIPLRLSKFILIWITHVWQESSRILHLVMQYLHILTTLNRLSTQLLKV